MRIGENAGKLPFLHGDGSAAAKSSEQKKSTVTDILSRAVEVYISAKGKSLSESADMEEDLTPAEMALAANEKRLRTRRRRKRRRRRSRSAFRQIPTSRTRTRQSCRSRRTN